MIPIIMKDIDNYTRELVGYGENNEASFDAKEMILNYMLLKQKFDKNIYNSQLLHRQVSVLVKALEDQKRLGEARSLLLQYLNFNEAYSKRFSLYADNTTTTT
jgi:hypothetical protein